MNNQEKNFINKINEGKRKNIPIINKNNMSDIHEKIINKIKRVNTDNSKQNKPNSKISNQAEVVIHADMQLRNAVKELVDNLVALNDKEIAQNLIGEHILMLNDIFKMFE